MQRLVEFGFVVGEPGRDVYPVALQHLPHVALNDVLESFQECLVLIEALAPEEGDVEFLGFEESTLMIVLDVHRLQLFVGDDVLFHQAPYQVIHRFFHLFVLSVFLKVEVDDIHILLA